jgi:DNA repair exonuclease SbcCD ATPase subunit
MSTDDLATQIAVRAGLPLPDVERVFEDLGLIPGAATALPRPIQLLRLRVAGSRSVEPRGNFEREFRFDAGLTVLAADNLRGKTSVFEMITWCLRGSPRSNLQGVVRSWLSRLECDAVVAGRPLGFRLTLSAGELVEGRVLSATNAESLARAQTARPGSGVVEVLHASDQDTFAVRVEALMMELLHLERLDYVSSRAATGNATFGWPAYFGALYLPPGGEAALLGDVVVGGLAGRLLQVFLDLPGAALLTRLKTARDQRDDADRAAEDDATRMWQLLESQRHIAMRRLDQVRSELAELANPPATADILAAVSALTASAVMAEAGLREARETYEALRWQRRVDEKRLNDVLEHEAARILFHALDPQVCPRCEAPIRPARRVAERSDGVCAVCTEPIDHGAADHPDAKAAEQEARWRLTASRDAEKLAAKHRDEVAVHVTARRRELADAESRLAAAQGGEIEERRRGLVNEVARLEGKVAAWESLPVSAESRRDEVRVVLDAAVAILTDAQAAASDDLFDELNTDIAGLARDFGFRNLDHVVIDRAGRLQVFKAGGPREWFRTQSPGERLRLRIAVVVALLRMGHRHGVATHPGLLLIDSPRSEEVQDDDAAALLIALEQLCAETPGLQILVTTADEHLVRRTLRRSAVITPPGPGRPLW